MAGESARHKKVRQAVSNLIILADADAEEKGLPLPDYSELDDADRRTADQIAKNLINLVDALREKPTKKK